MMGLLLQGVGMDGEGEVVNWALFYFGVPKIFYIINTAWSFFSL